MNEGKDKKFHFLKKLVRAAISAEAAGIDAKPSHRQSFQWGKVDAQKLLLSWSPKQNW